MSHLSQSCYCSKVQKYFDNGHPQNGMFRLELQSKLKYELRVKFISGIFRSCRNNNVVSHKNIKYLPQGHCRIILFWLDSQFHDIHNGLNMDLIK